VFFNYHDGPQVFQSVHVQFGVWLAATLSLVIENAHLHKKLEERECSLRQAECRKNELIATLSYELRNPLAPIKNSLVVLGRAAPSSRQTQRAIAVIDRQVGVLVQLVDELRVWPVGSNARAPSLLSRANACAAAVHRILIIEDDVDAAEVLRDVLELSRHVVEVASNGRTGVERAGTFNPSIILCDIGLPDIDGFEVGRRLRCDNGFHGCLIAFTGYAHAEDVARAREAGFDFHLAKPLPPDELEIMLARIQSPKRFS
jgi:CheY-like chemotaxis protein